MSYDPEQIVTYHDLALPAADALCALYNESHTIIGRGPPLDRVVAAAHLVAQDGYADYLRGRVIKVDFQGELFLGKYDRDMGAGAGEAALRRYVAENPNLNPSPTQA